MKAGTKLLCAGLLAVLLINAAPAALAQEAVQPRRWLVVQGRLEAKTESGFTLSSQRGEVTVSVDVDTRYRVPGVERATLAGLQVGDTVIALGRRADSGEWIALMVAALPLIPVRALKGQVTGIEAQTLTVSIHNGEKALLTDENTHFQVPGLEQASLADIKIGDRVVALVRSQEGDTLLAKVVTVLPKDASAPAHLRGRVIQVEESSLKVQALQDKVTVTVTETTEIRVPGIESPTLSDIRIGDTVLAIGRATGWSQMEARVIGALPPIPAHNFIILGKVLDIDNTRLTVQDRKDRHVVYTDELTQFRVPGVENPTVADIQIGDRIVAVGQPTEGRNLLARWIIARPAPPQEVSVKPPTEDPSLSPSF
jgi:hypothetical protein